MLHIFPIERTGADWLLVQIFREYTQRRTRNKPMGVITHVTRQLSRSISLLPAATNL